MNKIDARVALIKQEKRIGYMTHVVVGYPTMKDMTSLVEVMDEAGVDFIELQIPFSDPLADGPTIMKACEESLEAGTKVSDAFTAAADLSMNVRAPLLFMAYYNTVFKYGVEKFCRDAHKAGISGLIVPDMPFEEEEREGFSKYAKENNLHVIRVISPASTMERMRKNASSAQGFIYCTSRQGTTGNQKKLDPSVVTYLARVKKASSVPIAVGFGIKEKKDVELIKQYADIVVVGSAIVTIAGTYSGKELRDKVRSFLGSIRV